MPAKRRDLLLPNDSEGSYWVLSNQGVTRGKRETKTLAAGRIKAWRHNKAAPLYNVSATHTPAVDSLRITNMVNCCGVNM